jgi:hypothetical protein
VFISTCIAAVRVNGEAATGELRGARRNTPQSPHAAGTTSAECSGAAVVVAQKSKGAGAAPTFGLGGCLGEGRGHGATGQGRCGDCSLIAPGDPPELLTGNRMVPCSKAIRWVAVAVQDAALRRRYAGTSDAARVGAPTTL